MAAAESDSRSLLQVRVVVPLRNLTHPCIVCDLSALPVVIVIALVILGARPPPCVRFHLRYRPWRSAHLQPARSLARLVRALLHFSSSMFGSAAGRTQACLVYTRFLRRLMTPPAAAAAESGAGAGGAAAGAGRPVI